MILHECLQICITNYTCYMKVQYVLLEIVHLAVTIRRICSKCNEFQWFWMVFGGRVRWFPRIFWDLQVKCLSFYTKGYTILYKSSDISHESSLRFTENRSLGGHDAAHLLEMQWIPLVSNGFWRSSKVVPAYFLRFPSKLFTILHESPLRFTANRLCRVTLFHKFNCLGAVEHSCRIRGVTVYPILSP